MEVVCALSGSIPTTPSELYDGMDGLAEESQTYIRMRTGRDLADQVRAQNNSPRLSIPGWPENLSPTSPGFSPASPPYYPPYSSPHYYPASPPYYPTSLYHSDTSLHEVRSSRDGPPDLW